MSAFILAQLGHRDDDLQLILFDACSINDGSIFDFWKKIIGHECRELDCVRTDGGVIYFDQDSLFKPGRDITLFFNDTPIYLQGDFIITKYSDSAEILLFDTQCEDDVDVINHWHKELTKEVV